MFKCFLGIIVFSFSFSVFSEEEKEVNGFLYDDIYNAEDFVDYRDSYDQSIKDKFAEYEYSDTRLDDVADSYETPDDLGLDSDLKKLDENFNPDMSLVSDEYLLTEENEKTREELDYFTDEDKDLAAEKFTEENGSTPEEGLTEEDVKDESRSFKDNNSCNVSSDEETICANIVCDFGLLFGKWSSECTDYKLKLAILKSSTPPWKSLPKCFSRDESCNKSGSASKEEMNDDWCYEKYDSSTKGLQKRHECLNALGLQTKLGAEQYMKDHGVEDTSELDDIEFPEKDPESVGNDYIMNVDSRYEYAEDLQIKYKGKTVMDDLTMVLKLRKNGDANWTLQGAQERLYEQNKLLPKCLNVPDNQFYNCNNYPDLPQECWSSPSEAAISACLARIERRKAKNKAEAQAANVLSSISDVNQKLGNTELTQEKIDELNVHLEELENQLKVLNKKISDLTD